MRIRCFLATSTGLIAATIAWLLVAALGGQPAVAQQPDSAITAQPFAILHSDIPRTNCVGDTILLTNSLQGTISATVWLASSSTNPASGWSLQGVTLDSLQRGVLDVPLRTPIPVTVRFCGVAPVGETLTDTLVVRWVSAGATQLLTVPLQATITPVWGAPADTAFPNPITVGSQELLTVLATNRTSRPITVTTAKLENPFGDQGFAIVAPSSQTTVGPRQSLPLQIRFIANSYSQSPVANTVIINERDTLTELRIGVQARTAQASQPPQLSDTILQFGAVARGDCKKDSVMIDGGNSMLEIDTAWIASNGNLSGSQFRIASPAQFPLQSRTVVQFVLLFCPDSATPSSDTAARLMVRYRSNGQNPQTLQVELRGSVKGDTALPTISPMQLNFGAVWFDTCVTDTFRIVGDSKYQVIRADFWRSNQSSDPRFTLVEPQQLPMTITQNGVQGIVRFCPDSTIADTAATLYLFTNWSVTPIAIQLKGRGVRRPEPTVERNQIRLNGTTGQAGTKFELPITLSAPLRPDQNVRNLFFRMRMPARALYPVSVSNAAGTIATHSYTVAYAADTAMGTLEVSFPGPITGQTIARIEFLGFTTGYPETVIWVDSVVVGSPVVAIDTATGIVELEGCEIGKGIGFTKRARITSIRPSPLTATSTIHYIAPDGLHPTLRLIDLVGGTARTIELPAGTGREEPYHPDLHGVAPGIYLLELHVGPERNVIPVIITGEGG